MSAEVPHLRSKNKKGQLQINFNLIIYLFNIFNLILSLFSPSMYVRMYVRVSDKAFESVAKEYGASSPTEINLIKTEVSTDECTCTN